MYNRFFNKKSTKKMADDNTKFADTLAGQMTVQTGGNIANNIINRMFNKRDRNINWIESQRYGERNLDWQQQQAKFEQGIAQEQAQYNQALSKEYFDYTSDYSKKTENMKKAGLNPALMYSQGAGQYGQTGGAQASSPRINAPSENYKPMGMPIADARETPAETKLKLAQARNLDVQSDKMAGVDTEKTTKEIENISQGIENEKAKNALINAQTTAEQLANKLKSSTLDEQIQIIEWTSRKAKSECEMAENEAYISNQTMEEKIQIVKQKLYNSVIEASLMRSEISLNNSEKADIASKIADRLMQQSQRGQEIKIEWARQYLNDEISQYQNLGHVAGKLLDGLATSIFNGLNAINKATGGSYQHNWR